MAGLASNSSFQADAASRRGLIQALALMRAPLTSFGKYSIALLALLSIGPLVTGLDLLIGFLPMQIPTVSNLHSALPHVQIMWIASGFMGTAAIFSLTRYPLIAALAGVAFAMLYVAGAVGVWRHFTLGCWLTLTCMLLIVFAGRQQHRANNLFKPTPLRGAA